jgi:16S rRNA C967 or C1407 C5-methylase (RsmB/RsmF family)
VTGPAAPAPGAEDGEAGAHGGDEPDQGLLATVGVRLLELAELPRVLERLKLWNGNAVPKWLKARVERDWREREQTQERIAELEKQRWELLRNRTAVGVRAEAQSAARDGVERIVDVLAGVLRLA